jgi:predicted ATPase
MNQKLVCIPHLLSPLARLIARSAQHTRIWIVTHSDFLAEALQREMGKPVRRIVKLDGATSIEGLKVSGEFHDDEDDALD